MPITLLGQASSDLLPYIFSFLDPQDLKNCKLVCKDYKNAVTERVWQVVWARIGAPFAQATTPYENKVNGYIHWMLDFLLPNAQLLPPIEAIQDFNAYYPERAFILLCEACAKELKKDFDAPKSQWPTPGDLTKVYGWWQENIEDLRKIKYLVLTNLQLLTVPHQIKDLQSLEVILLDSNHLIEFPTPLTLISNLQSLNLCDNNIEFIPKEIGHWQKMTFLSLCGNRKLSEDTIIFVLETLRNLDELWLSDLPKLNVHNRDQKLIHSLENNLEQILELAEEGNLEKIQEIAKRSLNNTQGLTQSLLTKLGQHPTLEVVLFTPSQLCSQEFEVAPKKKYLTTKRAKLELSANESLSDFGNLE